MNNKTKNLIRQCNICSKLKATSICYKCFNYFCDNCFKEKHNIQKESGHEKESIDAFIQIDVKCPLHQEEPLNLFCVNDKGK